MKTVCILSDTHGILPSELPFYVAESDYCIHAGDIGDPRILRELELYAPTVAVLGNNDFREYGKRVGRVGYVCIEGVGLMVAHYARDVRRAFAQQKEPANFTVCIHGHTHVPEFAFGDDAFPADVLLCPGALNYPRAMYPRTFVMMDIEEGALQRVKLLNLNGKVLEDWGALLLR